MDLRDGNCHALCKSVWPPLPKRSGPEPKIRGYCLVTGERPDEDRAAQQTAIHTFLARHPEIAPDGAAAPAIEWYADHETAGGLELRARPAGRRLMTDLRADDRVVVTALALMAPSPKDLQVTVELLRHIQATLVTCELGPVSLTTPEGAVVLDILKIATTMQTNRLRARGRLANRNRVANGLSHLGPPRYGWVYRWEVRDGTRVKVEVPDPEEHKLLRRLLLWVEQGQSYDQILERLNRGEAPNIDKRSGQPSRRPWSRAKLHGMVTAARRMRRTARVQQTVRAERAERSRTT